MSVTIETIITCDGRSQNCEGNDWSADSRNLTATAQRRLAREQQGWKYRDGKDYCRCCWDHKKQTENTDR